MTKPTEASGKTALILAGAVAKGAFEAGVIEVLVERGVPMSSVVGASAGALNAAVLAIGLRAGAPDVAARRLVELWRDDASVWRAFHPTLLGALRGEGLSTMRAVRGLLERATRGFDAGVAEVALDVVVTPLRGETEQLLGAAASTYEHGERFVDAALDAPGRGDVFDHALASASFPVAFTPFELGTLGPCVDGGSVNNTPIKRALASGATRILVVTTSPRVHGATGPERGFTLLGDVAEILINERLFRDLHDAGTVNDLVDDLEAFVKEHPQTSEARAALERMLRSPRKVEIVEIRPDRPLPGNAFSGFFCKKKREGYIAAGRAAAVKALAAVSATPARSGDAARPR